MKRKFHQLLDFSFDEFNGLPSGIPGIQIFGRNADNWIKAPGVLL